MTNPYLERVSPAWTRAAGVALLLVGAPLTVFLVLALFVLGRDIANANELPTGILVILCALVAVCGFCWQAGIRLALNRPNRHGTLFSPSGWAAVGLGLAGVMALAAVAVYSQREPTLNDYQVLLFGFGLSVWCFVLAYRAHKRRHHRVPSNPPLNTDAGHTPSAG